MDNRDIVADIRARHVSDGFTMADRRFCVLCDQLWPCDAARAADTLEASKDWAGTKAMARQRDDVIERLRQCEDKRDALAARLDAVRAWLDANDPCDYIGNGALRAALDGTDGI